MYSISDVAIQTGFSAHTLRYYEKIGLISSPNRSNGKRVYTDGDIRLLQFMKILKNTGMSLEDIQEFLQGGCLFDRVESDVVKDVRIERRIQILEKHLLEIKEQQKKLDMVMSLTEEKLSMYYDMLRDDK